MTRKKAGFAVLSAIFLIAAVFVAGNAIGGGPGGGHGGFGHDHLLGLMGKLDLSDAQKTAIANILKQNEASAKDIVTGLANAKAQIARDILSGSDQSVIAADSQASATYEAQAAQLLSQIVAQMLPNLSADQKTIIQGMQEKIGANINDRIDARFAHLDKWIAKHSQ